MRDLERERKERTGYSPFHTDDPRRVVRLTVSGWDPPATSTIIPPRDLLFPEAQGASHKKEELE